MADLWLIIVKGPLNIIKRDGIATYVCAMYLRTDMLHPKLK